MKQLLPLGLLFLCGCEQQLAVPQPAAPQATVAGAQQAAAVDSYMRGYAQYEQCLWGHGTCAVGASSDVTARSTSPSAASDSLRTPRVRLTLQNQQLHVQFLSPFDPTVKVITIRPGEEFFVAQPETEALGAHAIKIKRGRYPLDQRLGAYGGVHFNVQVY